jgi:hypothetical protein
MACYFIYITDLSFRNADENDDKFYVLAVEHKTKVDLSLTNFNLLLNVMLESLNICSVTFISFLTHGVYFVLF